MPNRIIKGTIHGSEKISALTDLQFRVWVALITYVDDYGRGDARPAIIKGTCFPLRDEITSKMIGKTLDELVEADCISFYEVDGCKYLCFPKWDKHQRIRSKVSKFPPPETSCGNLLTHDSNLRSSDDTLHQNAPENPESGIQNPESRIRNPESVVGGGDDEWSDEINTNTVEAYASNNLRNLSSGNMEMLGSFMDDLPDDVIRYGIDVACGNGKPYWNYVAAILQAWVEAGVKTVGDAKAEREKKPKAAPKPQAVTKGDMNYTQHDYTSNDYDWMNGNEDLEKLYGGGA